MTFMTWYSKNFNFHKTLTLKWEIEIQIYRKIEVHSFLCLRMYLSMTIHLCISFYIWEFFNKIRWGKFWLSSKEYPMEILTDETCTWFQKSMQLQIITATTTQNAREIWDFFLVHWTSFHSHESTKSDCKQHKCRRLAHQITRLKQNWKYLGWTKPSC